MFPLQARVSGAQAEQSSVSIIVTSRIVRCRIAIEIDAKIGVTACAKQMRPACVDPEYRLAYGGTGAAGSREGDCRRRHHITPVFTKPFSSSKPVIFTGYLDSLSTFDCSWVAI
jgi:hypothetical protein